MKRILISTAATGVLFLAATLVSNLPVKGNDGNQNREGEGKLEVQIGFSIAPVKLNLKDKDPELVGLGSYIVNAKVAATIATPALRTSRGIIHFLRRLGFLETGRLTT